VTEERLKEIEHYLMGLPPKGWLLAKEVFDEVRRLQGSWQENCRLIEVGVKENQTLRAENKTLQYQLDMGHKDLLEIRKLRALLGEARDMFKKYEMDVDDLAPASHRDFMSRINAALGEK
jgi:hypothetical protein